MTMRISKSPRILITRPRPEAEVFAQKLTSRGFDVVVHPMLEIKPALFDSPDVTNVQGLVFTSVQAVRIFCDGFDARDLPVYAVGGRTAIELRDRGFQHVFDADGAGVDLAVLIKDNVSDVSKPLLHIRGEHIAVPLDDMLAKHDIELQSLIVYSARQATQFNDGFSLDDVDAVTFFSRRTAEAFMALVAQGENSAKLRRIKALCISDAVLKCVQSDNRADVWGQAYVADIPNSEGMDALLQRLYKSDALPDILEDTKEMTMTNDKSTSSIDNAKAVIERFGGIRPMAKKVNVAVTTIQGWKKRNTIPAARREQILEAAVSHDVDLTDILPDSAADISALSSAANENNDDDVVMREAVSVSAIEADVAEGIDDVQPIVEIKAEKVSFDAETAPVSSHAESPRAQAPQRDADLAAQLAASEKKAITKSTWINFALIVIAIAAVVVLLWSPSEGVDEGRISTLENDVGGLRDDVSAVQAEQSFLSTLIPQDLDQRIAKLQDQARDTQEKLGNVIDQAGEATSEILDESLTFDQRLAVIGGRASEFAYSPQIASALERFSALNQTVSGQTQLDSSVSELNALFSSLTDEGGNGADHAAVGEALSKARDQSSALSDTFEGVPSQDMKAAALLLGMTQMRSSLNRDNEPFAEDLKLLVNLMGPDRPELVASLEKLAPHSEQGVLTPGGLIGEFRTLAGDTVVSSLKGEGVSFSDKAKARFNDVFQVEKDGELITGTPVQASVAKAQNLLEAGDIAGAIAQMESLEGEPRAKIDPWLEDARATLLAQELENLMGDGVGQISSDGGSVGSSRLIQDKESGINILVP